MHTEALVAERGLAGNAQPISVAQLEAQAGTPGEGRGLAGRAQPIPAVQLPERSDSPLGEPTSSRPIGCVSFAEGPPQVVEMA